MTDIDNFFNEFGDLITWQDFEAQLPIDIKEENEFIEKKDPEVMKLDIQDIGIFGVCPSQDEFFLIFCEYCNRLVKPQAILAHIGKKHSNKYISTYSFQIPNSIDVDNRKFKISDNLLPHTKINNIKTNLTSINIKDNISIVLKECAKAKDSKTLSQQDSTKQDCKKLKLKSHKHKYKNNWFKGEFQSSSHIFDFNKNTFCNKEIKNFEYSYANKFSPVFQPLEHIINYEEFKPDITDLKDNKVCSINDHQSGNPLCADHNQQIDNKMNNLPLKRENQQTVIECKRKLNEIKLEDSISFANDMIPNSTSLIFDVDSKKELDFERNHVMNLCDDSINSYLKDNIKCESLVVSKIEEPLKNINLKKESIEITLKNDFKIVHSIKNGINKSYLNGWSPKLNVLKIISQDTNNCLPTEDSGTIESSKFVKPIFDKLVSKSNQADLNKILSGSLVNNLDPESFVDEYFSQKYMNKNQFIEENSRFKNLDLNNKIPISTNTNLSPSQINLASSNSPIYKNQSHILNGFTSPIINITDNNLYPNVIISKSPQNGSNFLKDQELNGCIVESTICSNIKNIERTLSNSTLELLTSFNNDNNCASLNSDNYTNYEIEYIGDATTNLESQSCLKMCEVSKKRRRPVNPDLVLCKNRQYNPEKHCGVIIEETHKPCTRSLTCKTHPLKLRRRVLGRSKAFDDLISDLRQSKMEACANSGRPVPLYLLGIKSKRLKMHEPNFTPYNDKLFKKLPNKLNSCEISDSPNKLICQYDTLSNSISNGITHNLEIETNLITSSMDNITAELKNSSILLDKSTNHICKDYNEKFVQDITHSFKNKNLFGNNKLDSRLKDICDNESNLKFHSFNISNGNIDKNELRHESRDYEMPVLKREFVEDQMFLQKNNFTMVHGHKDASHPLPATMPTWNSRICNHSFVDLTQRCQRLRKSLHRTIIALNKHNKILEYNNLHSFKKANIKQFDKTDYNEVNILKNICNEDIMQLNKISSDNNNVACFNENDTSIFNNYTSCLNEIDFHNHITHKVSKPNGLTEHSNNVSNNNNYLDFPINQSQFHNPNVFDDGYIFPPNVVISRHDTLPNSHINNQNIVLSIPNKQLNYEHINNNCLSLNDNLTDDITKTKTFKLQLMPILNANFNSPNKSPIFMKSNNLMNITSPSLQINNITSSLQKKSVSLQLTGESKRQLNSKCFL